MEKYKKKRANELDGKPGQYSMVFGTICRKVSGKGVASSGSIPVTLVENSQAVFLPG